MKTVVKATVFLIMFYLHIFNILAIAVLEYSVRLKLSKHESVISIECHADAPLIDEQKKRISLHVDNLLHIACSVNCIYIDLILVLNPSDMLIWQILKSDLHIVLIFKSEFKHVKLKHPDHADYDFFHAALVLLEHLDSTLLRYLCNALYKLLSLHGINK